MILLKYLGNQSSEFNICVYCRVSELIGLLYKITVWQGHSPEVAFNISFECFRCLFQNLDILYTVHFYNVVITLFSFAMFVIPKPVTKKPGALYAWPYLCAVTHVG